MDQTFVSIDSFCGAGGLSLGLEAARFRCMAAFDLDEQAIKSYNSNLRPVAVSANATDVRGDELRSRAGLPDQIDLFAGGPPCQGFSKQKRGAHLGDDRNNLVNEFARLVNELRPRFFLLENVDQFGGKRGRAFLDHVRELLSDYVLYPNLYNAADYGLAQTRCRFIVVGKHSSVRAPFRVPSPTVTIYRTVGEVIGDMPEPPVDCSEHPQFANHYRAKVSPANIARFAHVPQGGGWQDIPQAMRLPCHRVADVKSGGWPDVFGRLREDGQAPTITGGFDSFTRGRYGHPTQDRALTPREAARLQGFPDDFRFFGNRHDIRHQIGNAVPPPLATAIGRSIARSLAIEGGVLVASHDDYDLASSPQLVLNIA